MKEPLISIIIPAYNIEDYIERCLKSVCEQTYSNLEIIVVNDGSKDQTGNIIDKMAVLDKRIVAIYKENGGVSAARNTGLEVACGDYIGFVDGDDIIEKDMYELLVKNALKYDADISHCGYQMVFPNRVDYYYNTGEVRVQDNYQGVYDLIKADKVEPGLWNKIFKRELIGNIRLDETIRINEDLLFNYQMFKNAKISVYEDTSKYHYMIRENSAATSSVNKYKVKNPITVIRNIMNQEDGEIYQLLEKRYMYLLEKVSTMSGIAGNQELLKYQKERRKELQALLQSDSLKAQYRRKEWFQLQLAAKSPGMYHIIHEIYSRITGSKDRYKV